MITEQKKIDLPRFSDMANSFSKSGDLSLALVERTESLRAALTRIEELTEQVEKMPERIDLLARYLESSGWSVWTSDDPDLNRVKAAAKEAYEAHRDKSFTLATLEAHRAAIKAALLPSPPAEGDQG